VQRTAALAAISNFDAQKSLSIVTYPAAAAQNVPAPNALQANTLTIHKGEKINIEFICETLIEYNFERTDFVYEPGQYAVRGSIVDIFSYADNKPFRLDFFGNEIETIRSFDANTQLSIEHIDQLTIISKPNDNELEAKITDYLPTDNVLLMEIDKNNSAIIIKKSVEDLLKTEDDEKYINIELNKSEDHLIYIKKDLNLLDDHLKYIDEDVKYIENHLNKFEQDENLLYDDEKYINDDINKPKYDKNVPALNQKHISTTTQQLTQDEKYLTIDFNCVPQPSFNKNFEALALHVKEMEDKGYAQIICTEQAAQAERLHSIIANINQQQRELDYILIGLHEGFTDKNILVCLYTDHQIFARYHKYTLHGEIKKSERMTVQELNSLQAGDYVVHVDHGIGIFGGLVKQTQNGRQHEFIKLVYSDGDILMVSVHGLHRISKYKSKDSEMPKIHKLGSGVWARLKQTAKNKVKELARDLIALYAQRKEAKGFAFSADTCLQDELESSFMYEDTPDQAKTIAAVKKDMEQEMPMDRLICGDVGFGKTEIAIRAAFKAAADGKQTGVLVPTTILALQHYKTFSKRLKHLPCRVEYLSRFKNATETKQILKDLSEGKVDILIGTHKLLGKDVQFKDLGLLIVDEEQKFGVTSKEKLRKMRLNVDTLTLTATPIPRTLQFSLIGARDLSIIKTPPPNRQPVDTKVFEFDEELIKSAIDKELARGGQVFFVHNRIHNIATMEAMIKKLCPQASIITAHGQMDGNEMEKRVVAFINGEYDVLVSTNIVENGIDIPNANTMIVNQAHHFGLSDLHQLRGRVGRSNVKAYCYLLTAPADIITSDAQKRLRALEQFAELGSGFNIAMQDLDIRGAGNLLGSEQSGFILDLGFETYQKILDEALAELRQEEEGEMKSGDVEMPGDDDLQGRHTNFVSDCVIETDFELLLPDTYVSSVTEKVKLYREMDNLQNEDDISRFSRELEDRFGVMPVEVRELLRVVGLRQLGIRLGMEKIVIKQNVMVVYFVANPQSIYYQTSLFGQILQNVNKQSARMRLKEQNKRLSLVVQRVGSVEEAKKAVAMLATAVE
jgi:transcription-repair coupling factor (superfamily II helicase)